MSDITGRGSIVRHSRSGLMSIAYLLSEFFAHDDLLGGFSRCLNFKRTWPSSGCFSRTHSENLCDAVWICVQLCYDVLYQLKVRIGFDVVEWFIQVDYDAVIELLRLDEAFVVPANDIRLLLALDQPLRKN